MQVFRGTHALIDLKKLSSNIKFLRSRCKSDFFCPMVKANAYGHGDVEISKHLEKQGVQQLGVVTVEEGVALRASGVECEILTFCPYTSDSAEAVNEYRLTPVVSRFEDLESFKKISTSSNSVQIHLKFNTGMNRLGFSPNDAEKIKSFVEASNLGVLGICTHFMNGEDAPLESGITQNQILKFQKVREVWGPGVAHHYLNSASLLQLEGESAGARPGISIYGVIPPARQPVTNSPLSPILELKTNVVEVHSVQTGGGVSYGPTWTAERKSYIGVLPIGYADGLSRALMNRAKAIVDGQIVPLVGTICMDYCMVDLTDIPEAKRRNAEVVLIGKRGSVEITAKDLASSIGTIPYEILTRISKRVPRVYLHGGA